MSRCRTQCPSSRTIVPAVVRDVLRTPGTPLRPNDRTRFGHDFSNVRVHSGSDAAKSADTVAARAFTFGEHVVFGANEYAPDTPRGATLLDHELGHVVEQRNGPAEIARWPKDEPSEPEQKGESHHRKYAAPVLDNARMRIDAIPDMLLSQLATPRKIEVGVNDPAVQSIEWSLMAPDGHVITSKATTPGAADALTQPFQLESSHIGSVEGRYHLSCYGVGADGLMRVKGMRDFNMVTTDLRTGTPKQGAFGQLTFTEYSAHDGVGLQGGYVRAKIEFLPAADATPCDKLMFVQAVQALSPRGGNILGGTHRELAERASDQQWSIDQFEGVRSPFYSVQKDVATNKLVDRPEQGAIGHTGPSPVAAGLNDTPDAADDRMLRFETCALCRSQKPQKVYGCTTWGFYADTPSKPKLMPRTFSDGPSAEFLGAVAGWNKWFAETGKTP